MKRATLLCLFLTVLGFPVSVFGGKGEPTLQERRGESSVARRASTPGERLLLRQLQQARKAGDRSEMERLQRLLLPQSDAVPIVNAQDVVQPSPSGPAHSSAELWDQDVLIRQGPVGGNSIRGVCTDNDADGNIYVGIIDRGSTVDTFWVYKSVDQGATWQFLNGFYVGGRKLQSCAMHVTDSTGVRIVGILASAAIGSGRQDGSLYWVSFNENGGGWRATTILSASGGYGYNNVSLVSDGYDYSPGVTWWFGAAAYVDSLGNSDHILALRSLNWGATWPALDTLREGYDDRYPTIDYENLATQAQFHSTASLPIRDSTTTLSSIFVDQNIRIGVLHVQIDSLRHTWDADLDVYLFSPWGDSVELFTDVGSSGDNFIRTLLTDSANARITSGSAPFTGAFRPEATNTPDSSFYGWGGREAYGSWTLRIFDDADGDTGRIYGWSMWIDPLDVEEIYITGEYTYTAATQLRLFKQQASFGGTSGWSVDYVTSSGNDKDFSDFAVDWQSGEMGIVYSENESGDRNLKGLRSTDGGLSWSAPFDIAASARNEIFPSLDNSSLIGDWRLAYVDGGDSVMYRSSGSFGGLVSASSRKINDFNPTGTFRPEVGVHGRSFWSVGHVVYGGLGPQNIYYDAFNNQSMSIAISASWNLLSNPMHVANDSVHALFPSATYPYGFAYDSATGYQQEYHMVNGRGYWTKFPAATSHSFSGLTIDSDSIPVRTGWNLIGTVSASYDTGWVGVVPTGNRASLYFGYAAGYTAVQTLVPGQGYWVKMTQPGFVLFSPIILKSAPAPGTNALEGLGELRITDATGAGQSLFLGAGDVKRFPREFFAMPPHGPAGVFDARYASGTMTEVYGPDGGTFTIDLTGAVPPLTVSWRSGSDGRNLLVSDGRGASHQLSGGGQVTVTGPVLEHLVLSTGTGSVPREFTLMQNHPNPFNPVTVIRYALPAREHVTLRVFNVIGQEVATLVEEEQIAGAHEVRFDGAALGSGVYFCRIEAGTFSATRKMMLLK